LGILHYETGKYDKAKMHFENALKSNSNSWVPFINIASIHLKEGDNSNAIKTLNQAIAINPNHAAIYYNRGIAYERIQDYQNACKDWKKAKELGMKNLEKIIQTDCN
jgi:tetratricopeptide (TPR) repeat protein